MIGGPGAFVIAVNRYEEFADTLRSKLIIEIAGSGEHAVDVGLGEIGRDRRIVRVGGDLLHHP